MRGSVLLALSLPALGFAHPTGFGDKNSATIERRLKLPSLPTYELKPEDVVTLSNCTASQGKIECESRSTGAFDMDMAMIVKPGLTGFQRRSEERLRCTYTNKDSDKKIKKWIGGTEGKCTNDQDVMLKETCEKQKGKTSCERMPAEEAPKNRLGFPTMILAPRPKIAPEYRLRCMYVDQASAPKNNITVFRWILKEQGACKPEAKNSTALPEITKADCEAAKGKQTCVVTPHTGNVSPMVKLAPNYRWKCSLPAKNGGKAEEKMIKDEQGKCSYKDALKDGVDAIKPAVMPKAVSKSECEALGGMAPCLAEHNPTLGKFEYVRKSCVIPSAKGKDSKPETRSVTSSDKKCSADDAKKTIDIMEAGLKKSLNASNQTSDAKSEITKQECTNLGGALTCAKKTEDNRWRCKIPYLDGKPFEEKWIKGDEGKCSDADIKKDEAKKDVPNKPANVNSTTTPTTTTTTTTTKATTTATPAPGPAKVNRRGLLPRPDGPGVGNGLYDVRPAEPIQDDMLPAALTPPDHMGPARVMQDPEDDGFASSGLSGLTMGKIDDTPGGLEDNHLGGGFAPAPGSPGESDALRIPDGLVAPKRPFGLNDDELPKPPATAGKPMLAKSPGGESTLSIDIDLPKPHPPVPGPPGPRGPAGRRGPKGAPGRPGAPGKDGITPPVPIVIISQEVEKPDNKQREPLWITRRECEEAGGFPTCKDSRKVCRISNGVEPRHPRLGGSCNGDEDLIEGMPHKDVAKMLSRVLKELNSIKRGKKSKAHGSRRHRDSKKSDWVVTSPRHRHCEEELQGTTGCSKGRVTCIYKGKNNKAHIRRYKETCQWRYTNPSWRGKHVVE